MKTRPHLAKVTVIHVFLVTSTGITEIENMYSVCALKAVIYTHMRGLCLHVFSPTVRRGQSPPKPPSVSGSLLKTGLTAQTHTSGPERRRGPQEKGT